ncbi:MAG: cytochrome P450 [Pseudonocardia sp.]|nr:cytochrome P450 [Pseudonocardia sp.]
MTAPADWFPLRLPGAAADPAPGAHHALLARKRRGCPVERLTSFGPGGGDVVVVYGYADVAGVLADDERFSLDVVDERYGAVLGRSLVTFGPAARRALRRARHERFRPGEPDLARLREAVVAARLDAVAAAEGPVDLVPLLAAQVPARIVTALIGLPEHEWAGVAELAAGAAVLLDEPRRALRAARALRRRFAAVGRDGPPAGLLGTLTTAEVDGRPLDEAEVTASLLLLAWAGTETAFPAILNCVYALLTHPDQAAAVRAEPGLAPSAADEALRWEAPVQVTARRARVDVEIAGTAVSRGTTVLVHLGAANRDPRAFAEPDRFRIDRTDRRPHLAFGHGPHRCLGAQLARAEVAACARGLLERFPGLRLAPESPPPRGQVVRSPRRLLVCTR